MLGNRPNPSARNAPQAPVGREWQTATIQLDYQPPARFGLKFVNRDNHDEMPVVIHRALLGSFERFLGILIEHYAGAFPTWLAPLQARVLTISEKFETYGNRVVEALQAHEARVEKDFGADKIGAKVREGRLQRVPYLLTVGEREAAEETVAVRSQKEGDLGTMPLAKFLERLDAEKSRKF